MSQSLGTALITGASSGIGAVYADRLARRGHDLLIVARDADRLAHRAARLERDFRVNVEVLPGDLIEPDQLAAVGQRLADDSSISILINNAGMSMDGTLMTASHGRAEALIALNVLAPTLLARAAGRRFAAERKGAIINISSVMAFMPEVSDGTYSGTKAFLLNLSLGLAEQLEPLGVRIQAVLPGATRTEIWKRSGKDIDALPADSVMSAEDLVDAALVGFDKGEIVSIPPLHELGLWEGMNRSRLALAPHLANRRVADRYLIPVD
ncbi:SDR family NAD(P)-dependent oxidoreductase [Mesorhizobium escarrei]|uniref:NADP-dependent 3-hydroxy acid dehydrogenase YdfG n=1 Tax=Mesorhizobium escarrei TaxID=666018 RepID=A0ABN8KCF9_9HYPH|nr:SDR family NAD(P)-dependent oxidoreductase [Mesorhizobium escarrei]CAH2407938.1 conserved hypothetical protein [Mesorhizobium escarrei]